MVLENISEIIGNFSDLIGGTTVRSFLIKVGVGASIAIIIYVIYLIIKGIFKMRIAGNIKKILKELKKVNSKLDILVKKKGKK